MSRRCERNAPRRLHKRHAEVEGLDPKTEPTLPGSTSQASDVFQACCVERQDAWELGDDMFGSGVMMLATFDEQCI
jgi:hypothetical protein